MRLKEGSGTHNVKVGFFRRVWSDITVHYTVSGGSATPGSDFTIANSGTVTVPAGAKSATIPVTVIDDSLQEGYERFHLTLVGGEGYRVLTHL